MKISLVAGLALAVALAACSTQQQDQAQSSAQQIASSAPGVAQNAYLATAVTAKLVTVDVNAASEVHVSVNDGAVVLSGKALDLGERAKYEQAAKSVNGVVSVSDTLSIDPHLQSVGQQAVDAEIETRVTAAIVAKAGTNVFHVTPNTRNAIVTLRGHVPNRSTEQTIVAAVRGVSGVKSVVDRLTVR